VNPETTGIAVIIALAAAAVVFLIYSFQKQDAEEARNNRVREEQERAPRAAPIQPWPKVRQPAKQPLPPKPTTAAHSRSSTSTSPRRDDSSADDALALHMMLHSSCAHDSEPAREAPVIDPDPPKSGWAPMSAHEAFSTHSSSSASDLLGSFGGGDAGSSSSDSGSSCGASCGGGD
jgi:hypothetical protein